MSARPCSARTPARAPARSGASVQGRAFRFAPLLGSGQVPGIVSGSFTGDLIRLVTPDAEFTVRLDRPTPEIEAVFREDRADGRTWWAAWRVRPATPDTGATAAAIAAHIAESRRRFAGLLAQDPEAT
ncbi:hypothetical protein [Actinomadura kijaniata]|uniref:hypothetical protein n=1 Tax=Actinomadura kijaniata TaxID=46161 RepID=UPI00082FD396|nr:hypothetical protein [Actinomadura kijaniata]